MRRLFRSFSLVLLAAALGVSTGLAQPSSSAGNAGLQAGDVAAETDLGASSAATDEGALDSKSLTRAEVRSVMLGGGEPQGQGVAVDLSTTPEPLQQEASSNRTIYYIVGGALVAGGLVAGILALDDGGGGGGQQGIPPPPGRP